MQPKIKVEDNILIIEDKHGTKYLNVHDLKQLLGIAFNAFFLDLRSYFKRKIIIANVKYVMYIIIIYSYTVCNYTGSSSLQNDFFSETNMPIVSINNHYNNND